MLDDEVFHDEVLANEIGEEDEDDSLGRAADRRVKVVRETVHFLVVVGALKW